MFACVSELNMRFVYLKKPRNGNVLCSLCFTFIEEGSSSLKYFAPASFPLDRLRASQFSTRGRPLYLEYIALFLFGKFKSVENLSRHVNSFSLLLVIYLAKRIISKPAFGIQWDPLNIRTRIRISTFISDSQEGEFLKGPSK